MILLDFKDGEERLPSGNGPPLRITIGGDIDADMLARVAADLTDHPDAAELHLDINSPGGDFGAAFDLYALLRRHRAALKVSHIGRAESAALIVALAADERIAAPAAPMLLHSVEQQPGPRWTAHRHAEAADFLAWADANMAALFAYRTGHRAQVFTAAMGDEEPSPLDWCLNHNIITGIA